MSTPHRIRRQELLLSVPDQATAPRLQNRAMQALRAAGLHMERVLDRHAPSHGCLRIDRLELDLGTLSAGELETGLLERLPRALAEALDAVAPLPKSPGALQRQGPMKGAERRVRGSALDPGARADESTQAASRPGRDARTRAGTGVDTYRPGAVRLSERERTLQAVLGYLETGRLPWWSTTLPKETGKNLLQAATDEPVVAAELQRFLIRSPEDLLPRLVELIGPAASDRWARSRMADGNLYPSESAFDAAGWRTGEERIRLLLVAAISLHGAGPPVDALARVLRRLFPTDALTRLRKALYPTEGKSTSEEPSAGTKAFAEALKSAAGDTVADGQGIEPAANRLKPPTSVSKSGRTPRDGTPATKPAYLKSAGCVLLNPFLPPLFQALELSDAIGFRDRQARERAVRLLEYLAWGDSGRPEYELILEKHLCGMPPEVHLGQQELKPPEREEGDRMLAAVIGHWKALKSTSPKGLREGFLQREGRLDLDSDEQVLRVSPAPQDVLLGALPWPVSIVRLPWMEQPLRVEWGT